MDRRLDDGTRDRRRRGRRPRRPDADVNREPRSPAGAGPRSSPPTERGEAVVVLRGLPELDEDQTYQLWYIDDPDVPLIRSAGTIGPSVDTSPTLLTEIDDAQLVALSVEPSGGSEQPTTTPLTAVPLT